MHDEEARVPPAVRLVRDFVNTYEPQVDEEALTAPERLRDWFADRGLVPADARLRPADLALAITVREGLRSVLLGHAGHRADPAALADLDRALAAVPVRMTFADGAHGWRRPAVAPSDRRWPRSSTRCGAAPRSRRGRGSRCATATPAAGPTTTRPATRPGAGARWPGAATT